MHYRGMPQLVDADLAKRILLLEDDDIRTAVDGLLEQGEVEALVARFTVVKSKIAQIAKSGGLVKVWDAATAAKARPENTRDMRDIDKKSYQHNLTFDAMEKIKKNVQAALNVNRKTDIGAYFEAPAQAYLTELGPPADAGVFNGAVQVVMAVFYERLVTGKIDPAKAMETAWKMMGALLGDLAKDPARKKRVRDEFAKTKSFGYASAAADILKEVTIVLYQSDFGATMPALPATPTPPVTAKA
jgi:hypothetical protein